MYSLSAFRSTSVKLINARGLRAVRAIFRQNLPRYKRSLKNLPPLSDLFTVNDGLKKLEIYKQYMPINYNTNLIDALFHSDNDLDRLLCVIRSNLEEMNSFYLAISFEALDDLMHAKEKACDPASILVAPEFAELCKKTLLKLRFFESDEILKLIRCLSTLGLPEDTLLVQAALKMATHLVNDFNQAEMNLLGEALGKMSPTSSLLTIFQTHRGGSDLTDLSKVKPNSSDD